MAMPKLAPEHNKQHGSAIQTSPDLRQGITFCPLDGHGAVLSAEKRFG